MIFNLCTTSRAGLFNNANEASEPVEWKGWIFSRHTLDKECCGRIITVGISIILLSISTACLTGAFLPGYAAACLVVCKVAFAINAGACLFAILLFSVGEGEQEKEIEEKSAKLSDSEINKKTIFSLKNEIKDSKAIKSITLVLKITSVALLAISVVGLLGAIYQVTFTAAVFSALPLAVIAIATIIGLIFSCVLSNDKTDTASDAKPKNIKTTKATVSIDDFYDYHYANLLKKGLDIDGVKDALNTLVSSSEHDKGWQEVLRFLTQFEKDGVYGPFIDLASIVKQKPEISKIFDVDDGPIIENFEHVANVKAQIDEKYLSLKEYINHLTKEIFQEEGTEELKEVYQLFKEVAHLQHQLVKEMTNLIPSLKKSFKPKDQINS